MMHRDDVRSADSFVLDYLREHSQNNQALKSAIKDVDQEYEAYQQFLESEKPDDP
jgi:hypothetical protein